MAAEGLVYTLTSIVLRALALVYVCVFETERSVCD